MILPKDEHVLGFIQYQGNPSKYTVQKFSKLFDNNRVKVYLMDEATDIVTRVKTIIRTVNEINPKFIFSLSYYSTAQNILYKYYPIVNFSFGHEYLPAKAHLYLYKNDKRAKQLANKFKDKVKIENYKQPPMNIPRTKTYNREQLGYKDDDFIIIVNGKIESTEIAHLV